MNSIWEWRPRHTKLVDSTNFSCRKSLKKIVKSIILNKKKKLVLQIEREVVLSSTDKNSKIPILHEYKQRSAGRVAIAPDAPIKQQAWVQEVRNIYFLFRQFPSEYFRSPTIYKAIRRSMSIRNMCLCLCVFVYELVSQFREKERAR